MPGFYANDREYVGYGCDVWGIEDFNAPIRFYFESPAQRRMFLLLNAVAGCPVAARSKQGRPEVVTLYELQVTRSNVARYVGQDVADELYKNSLIPR